MQNPQERISQESTLRDAGALAQLDMHNNVIAAMQDQRQEVHKTQFSWRKRR